MDDFSDHFKYEKTSVALLSNDFNQSSLASLKHKCSISRGKIWNEMSSSLKWTNLVQNSTLYGKLWSLLSIALKCIGWLNLCSGSSTGVIRSCSASGVILAVNWETCKNAYEMSTFSNSKQNIQELLSSVQWRGTWTRNDHTKGYFTPSGANDLKLLKRHKITMHSLATQV